MNMEKSPTIYSPEFIPFYPEIQKKYKLNDKETLIYGFIRFYISTSPEKEFYFSNENLSEIFGISTTQISIYINSLAKKCPEIEITYRIKADGGKIRYIKFRNKENLNSDFKKTLSPTLRKLKENNNKINNNINLLNNKLVKNQNEQYGNKFINLILDKFKQYKNFYPTDKNPRQRAWNLFQKINSFLKKNPNLPETVNTFEKLLEKYFYYLSKKDYFSRIENLETVVRKIEIYFGLIEKKVKENRLIKEIEKRKEEGFEKVVLASEEAKKKFEEAKKRLLEKFDVK